MTAAAVRVGEMVALRRLAAADATRQAAGLPV